MHAKRGAYAKGPVDLGSTYLDLSIGVDQFQDRVVKRHLGPKISVLLITYNHEKYIAQALESVLMQETEYDYEINVIEDCSTDGTQEIVMRYVEKYPLIVKPHFNAKNIGRKVTQKNFYRGFKTLRGDYFAILEGDDYWSSPHKLQKQIAFLEANPEFAICACNTIKVYEDGSKDPHRFLYWGRQDDGTIEDVINLRTFFHTTGVMYRNVFKGIPPRHYCSKWSCDIFIMISHAQFGKVRHLDEDMAVYRAHSAGMFSNMPLLDAWMFNIDGLRRYNAWLGYRHFKAFAESIARYCKHVLTGAGKGEAAPLSFYQFVKILSLRACYGFIYITLDLPQQIRSLFGATAFLCCGIIYTALDLPRKIRRKALLLLTPKTILSELPKLPDSAEWHFIWGLNAKVIRGRQIVTGQPILQLTAVRTKDRAALNRHALCERIRGLVPGSGYRLTLWVKAGADTDIHIQLRDSIPAESCNPAHECDVRFSLPRLSVKMCNGDARDAGIDWVDNGWLNVWVDFVTSDGLIYVYLGLVKRTANSHVFNGAGEQVLFGGIEIRPSPAHPDQPRQIKHMATPKALVFARKPPMFIRTPLLLSRKTELSELPNLPDSVQWDFIRGLNAKAIEDQEIVADQPVLQLSAVPTKDRHAVCECLSGFIPGSAYRVTLLVNARADTNIHVQLRDSVVAQNGKPTNECDVWFNLSSQSVRKANGNLRGRGIELDAEGWLKVWVDFVTSDPLIYVCLGLLKKGSSVFRGAGEQVMFGGIEVCPAPEY